MSNSHLLVTRVRVGGRIPQDKHKLWLLRIQIRGYQVEVVVAEDFMALWMAARAGGHGDHVVGCLGVMAGTGGLPMGRGGGYHGDDRKRWDRSTTGGRSGC